MDPITNIFLYYGGYVAICAIVYSGVVVLYRLYFSPLAQFPGPRLAAATGLYEAYFQLVKGGIFTWEINRLHDQYGPIVRIKPGELHIKDPDYYNTLYAGPGKHRNKDPWFSFIAFPRSIFSTEGHALHSARRRVLGQFFKKNAVLQFEPTIRANVQLLCRHFATLAGSDQSLELHTAFQCFASDTMSQYAFGITEGLHYLDEPVLSDVWKTRITNLFGFCRLNRHIPILSYIAKMFPAITTLIVPPYGHFHQFVQDVRRLVRSAIKQHRESEKANTHTPMTPTAIYPSILADRNVPPSEKESARLEDDAIFVMMAGTDAPAQCLAITIFHILNNSSVYQKLQAELRANILDAHSVPTLKQLEALPYLSATIKEGLRLSSIVTTRLPRIAPDEVLQYREWQIPAGIPVSMSTYFILRDPEIFPDPTSFMPERWMLEPEDLKRLERYLVPASKGTLGCLGQNMNVAWMHLVIGTLLRRYTLDLHDTTLENVEMTRDNFIGQTPIDKNNIYVKVSTEEEFCLTSGNLA
ncbi:benzoate 4-monooxygenase cytochrome P450 [Aspergillus bertholletiae]|uniref:Benzoate 4-monooxygenase cytochrome P450 n=1 Tax=Aspergillus bertholletiae TaxID=1226010 RepID=A0A5N7BIR8_9EURO|nr:benzoate 4-monooxygenase cytochrome P450 [Aspergillus bertholletiae]